MVICGTTVLLVTAPYMGYKFMSEIAASHGLTGPSFVATLALFGAAGFIGVQASGRLVQHHPVTSAVLLTVGVTAALGLLAVPPRQRSWRRRSCGERSTRPHRSSSKQP